jgi:cell division protein ZapA
VAEMQQKSAADMSRSELAAQAAGAVVVEIYGQVYQLRGTDTAHIEKLAGIVDAKMRAVSAHGATVDSLRVAVLAALNIADEMMQAKAKLDTQNSSVAQVHAMQTMRSRAGSLAGMLDAVLDERKVG